MRFCDSQSVLLNNQSNSYTYACISQDMVPVNYYKADINEILSQPLIKSVPTGTTHELRRHL